MFELTKQEWSILRSQIVISSWGGSRYRPFAFMELGVAMLSSVLNSETADAFTDYNDINKDTRVELENINQKLSVTNVQFSEIYQALIELADQKRELGKPLNPIGFIQSENEIKSLT